MNVELAKIGLIGARDAARIKASVPRAEIAGSWRHFQAIAGIIAIIVLLLPIMVLPGLIVAILPAEIYLIDAVYSRISGTQDVTRSLPKESSTRGKREDARDFDGHTVARPTVFSLFTT